MLLKLLQIIVRSMFYCFITWNRYAPGRAARLIGQGGGAQAKR